MKFYGDIPSEHQVLVDELRDLEDWFESGEMPIDPLIAAKGMVCMGHDYYSIFFDEEGERLLNKAEKLYPGYFQGPIYLHMQKDPDFNFLVTNLRKSLALELLRYLGFDR